MVAGSVTRSRTTRLRAGVRPRRAGSNTLTLEIKPSSPCSKRMHSEVLTGTPSISKVSHRKSKWEEEMHMIRSSRNSGLVTRLGGLVITALAFVFRLHAAAGGNLPWERPMTTIATSLTGPVAYAIGLIGIAIAGGAMLWGGELTEFGRRACMIGLVVSVLVFAAPMLASAFGVNAAVV